MGIMKFGKLEIKTKIAISFSVFVLLLGICALLFLNLAVQSSMNNKPVITKTATVTVSSVDKGLIKYEKPVVVAIGSEEINMSAKQLNLLLSSEVFKRIGFYSVIAVLIIMTGTFLFSYFLSKWLMKPLTVMAKTTAEITAENLDVRLRIPDTDDELTQLSDAFNCALDGIQTAFYELERFNAYASHELKNALAVLKTRLEVDYKTGDCRETVGFALMQVDKISRTISDILAISSKKVKDSNELVDMALVAARAVDEYSANGENILLEIPEEGVPPVKGKEIWFQRVVSNLLDNAVKHSGEAGTIRVNVKNSYDAVIVAVSDDGKGIARSEQASIWEPYFTAAANNKGYGLGLAMVNHVIDICGGVVWVDSSPGQGSTFYISLPVAEGQQS